MKNYFLLLSVLFSFSLSAQTISGLYSGTLVNDSTRKTQRYEIALTEYKGKISGYSYTTFVRNDSLYYSVKKVKAERKNNQLVVEDDKMVINNFPELPAKHVHQINYINLTNEDTLRQADGIWETTRTKIYYSLHGSVAMKRDNDSSRSALIGHLKELGIIEPENRNNYTGEARTEVKVEKTKEKSVAVKENKTTEKSLPVVLPYNQRKNHMLHSIDAVSDSLVLSFYDNGVIDGDSISVYLNGINIIANNKLTATATRKTISTKDLGDEIELLVVAENLGTIPPNTGLVVIKDGDKTYQLNFTADMQTNAAIMIKKKGR
jgi:hypothetical protein